MEIHILHTGDHSSHAFPAYVQYLLTLVLFILILVIEIRMLEKKEAVELLKEPKLLAPEPDMIRIRNNSEEKQ